MPLDVTMPDGTVIHNIPEGTTKQQILEKYRGYKTKEINDAPPLAGHPSDARNTAGEVAYEQAGHVMKGAEEAVTGIPGMVKNVAGGIYDAVTGKGTKNLQDTVSGAVHGVVDPIATSVRGAAAYVAPDSVNPPSKEDWETAAEDAGNLAATSVAGEAIAKIPGAENLKAIANKAKAYRMENPTTLSSMDLTRPGTLVRPAVNVGAWGVEKLGNLAARAKTAIERPTDYNSQVPAEKAPLGATIDPGTSLQHVYPETGADYRTVSGPQNPIDPGASLQHVYPETGADSRVSSPSQPIEGDTPELNRMREDVEQRNEPVSYKTIPSASNPIEMANPPVDAEAPSGSPNSREVMMAREALLKDGAARSQVTLLKVARNVPYLLDTLPELRGVPPGQNFNGRLFNGFQRIGHELNATEASIPDETQVPTKEAVSQLKELEARYADTNQTAAIRTLDKVRTFLEERPSMAWKDFIAAKRSFFNEIKLSSGVGQQAYQIFKKISNDVSPELGKLNQKYFTVKSAVEHAAMDTRTGEKIRTIGKAAKPPIEEGGGKRFPLPL